MHLTNGPQPPAADLRAERPRPRLRRELAILALVVALYVGISRGGGLSREAIALAHGHDLLALERFLHIDVERALNAWLAPQELLSVLANYEYAFGYVVTSFGLLIILYLLRSPWYRWARTSFVLVNLIGISLFAIYPAAPPRLLPGAGYVDTVTQGGTFGSWGSPYTADANHLAAMPSLHVGWAVWATIVLSSIFAGRWWVKAICLLYVATTTTVIMATANHYILDAVGGALVTLASFALLTLVADKPHTARPRLTPAQAFAVYAESTSGAAQHAGHVIVLHDQRDAATVRAALRQRFEAVLGRLPLFYRRVVGGTFWRRPRWAAAGDLDWDWHLPAKDLAPAGGGPAALEAFVAGLQRAPLPRDRPLWRCWTVTGVRPGEVAVVLLTHHALAAGTIVTELFEPVPEPDTAAAARPGLAKRVGAVLTGAVELAREGPARHALPAGAPRDRDYGMARVPRSVVRAAARAYGVELDDVLRGAAAGALARLLPAGVAPADVRVAVPHSSAVLMDLPLAADDEGERLRETARRGDRLRAGARAMAARFVVDTASGVLPPPAQRAFARASYGRRSFAGIVSVLAGPAGAYRLAGGAVRWVHPVVPPAPGAPFAIGVVGWDRWLDIGVTVDPALRIDAHRLAAAMVAVIDEIARRSGPVAARPRTRSSEEFGPFWPVFREEGIPVRKDMG